MAAELSTISHSPSVAAGALPNTTTQTRGYEISAGASRSRAAAVSDFTGVKYTSLKV